VAFSIGRHLGQEAVLSNLSPYHARLLRALNHAIKEQGVRVLLLIHLAIIPESIKSYGLSILDVSLWLFTWTKLLGSLPVVSFLAYTGATTHNILKVLNHDKHFAPAEVVLVVTGMLCLFTFLVVIGIHVNRQMKVIESQNAQDEADGFGEGHVLDSIEIDPVPVLDNSSGRARVDL
jgi:uncharacterized membrane protein YdjX (TVP38/TMEM64 family)